MSVSSVKNGNGIMSHLAAKGRGGMNFRASIRSNKSRIRKGRTKRPVATRAARGNRDNLGRQCTKRQTEKDIHVF